MKCRNIKSSKKGYILATCMVIMTVVLLICTCILSVITYGTSVNKLNAVEFERRMYIDMIGEDFAADGEVVEIYKFTTEVEGAVTKTLTVSNEDSVLLTVERNSAGEITIWKYGE